MTRAGIVLARAGSKGVPGKNHALVAGRACVAWTLDDALGSRLDHVLVSTDSPEIAAIARSMGARVIDRPRELATDHARVDDAARHAARALPSDCLLAILYANVPVRPPDLIDRALDLLESSGAHSVQSYARVGKHHPWWTARLDPDGRARPWEGDVLNHHVFRRQDLPPAFVPDGGVLGVARAALDLHVPGAPPGPHAFLGIDRRGIETRDGDVVDIDSPIDLAVADAVLRARLASREHHAARLA